MKNLILLFLYLLTFPGFMTAQSVNDPVFINTKIESVKLHLEGAEVFRREKLLLKPGRNHFVFKGLSSKLYSETVQVMTDAMGVKVLSLTTKTNFLEKSREARRTIDLRDSVKLVRNRINVLEDEYSAYQAERELLASNRSFKGDDKTLTVLELQAIAQFYRSQTLEINRAISRLNKEIVINNRHLFDLKLQMHELNARQAPTSDVYLVLEAQRALQADLVLRYVVSDAGWAAIYDLESGDLSSPITLRYRALAFNNTGVDWTKVKLSLSTKDPLASASHPKLNIWSLDNYSASDLTSNRLDIKVNLSNGYAQNIGIYNQLQQGTKGQGAEIRTILGDDFNKEVDYDTDLYRRYRADKMNQPKIIEAAIDVPEFAIDFDIATPATIPTDNRPYSIDIEEHKLDVSYKYLAIPKLDKDAFLLAQIVGWEALNLCSGPVNIYNGRKFVGQSNLDIRNLSDTLEVSLGRDQRVVVTRLKVKGKTRRQILGQMNKSSVAYNITARNNHDKPINLEIRDQVPITSDREVIITIDEKGGAIYTPKTGLLTWSFSLQPGASQTHEFGFSIKYPRTKAVQIQYNSPRNVKQRRSF